MKINAPGALQSVSPKMGLRCASQGYTSPAGPHKGDSALGIRVGGRVYKYISIYLYSTYRVKLLVIQLNIHTASSHPVKLDSTLKQDSARLRFVSQAGTTPHKMRLRISFAIVIRGVEIRPP
jgi:hypothetical protein